MQEIGHAALAVIPSFNGFESKLEAGSAKAMAAAGSSGGTAMGKEAGDKATSELGAKLQDWSRKGAVVAGGLVGAAIGYGLKEGIDRERIGDVIAASQGLSAKAQQQQGKIAGSLYAKAFGESYEEVAKGVAAAASSLPGLEGNGEIRRASADALNFASTFEVDVARAVQVAGTAINSGLARDADQAFDLLTRSSQKVPTALREDVLDAVEEYGPFFTTLGFDGPQAFQLLVKGAEQGMYGIDKTGDALKEFTIRATDMSVTTTGAYATIGLDAQEMADKILKGGDDAQVATQKIIDGLLGIENPADRANAAIALFGTPVEDLNVSKIPAFLRGLQTTEDGLDRVKGSADRMADTLAGNVSTDITKMKRKLETDLVEFISKKGLPALESFSDWVKNDASPAFRNLKEDVEPAAKVLGDLVGAFNDLPGAGKVAAVGGVLAGGIVVKHKLSGIFDRGGIANPMFVVVTNPGGVPGVPGAPGGKPGSKVPPVFAGGSRLLSLIRPLMYGGVAAGALGNDDLSRWRSPVPKGKNPEYDAYMASGLSLEDWTAKKQKLDRDLADISPKVAAFRGSLDLVGSTKMRPDLAVPNLKDAKRGVREFIALQIEAGRPVYSSIFLSGIERANAQLDTLDARLHGLGERGMDNGVPYVTGGAGGRGGGTSGNGRVAAAGAGVQVSIGTVQAHDYDDFMGQMQRRSQQAGIGGFGP